MTNTKPTWEPEFDKEFEHESEYFICNKLLNKDCDCELSKIKAFIQKVEQEAYERGKEETAFLNMTMNGSGWRIKGGEKEELKKAVEHLSSIEPCEGCEKCKS